MGQAGYSSKIFDDGAMSATNTIYSERFSAKKGSLFSLHFEWAGTAPSGTLTLWQSNKPDPDPDSVTDWVQNSDVTFTSPAGSDSSFFLNVGNAAAEHYMVRYVNASGTGDLQCWLFGGKAA